MNTNILAAGVIGFLLGGLVVSLAAQLEDNGTEPPAHSSSSAHFVLPQDSTGFFSIGALP